MQFRIYNKAEKRDTCKIESLKKFPLAVRLSVKHINVLSCYCNKMILVMVQEFYWGLCVR